MVDVTLDRFSSLVDTVYKAGLDPGSWSNVVDDLSSLFGGTIVSLQAHDVAAGAGLGIITSEADRSFQESYNDYYAARNVWIGQMNDVPIGRTIHSEEFYDRRDLKRTEFYNDFLRRLDLVAASAIVLKRTGSSMLVLSTTMRDKESEHVTPAMRKMFDLLGPHILRSFDMMRHVPCHIPGEDYRETAEDQGNALFFLDRRGRVTHANGAGVAMRQIGTDLRVDRIGSLKLLDPRAELALRGALHAIAGADYLRLTGDFAIRRKGAMPLRASIVPLRRHEGQAIFDDVFEDLPIALLLVRHPPVPDMTSKLRGFGLTPAEMALALAIARGVPPRQYAESRGVSIHTVRSQLKAVYAKTETNRQSQVVALVMSGRD